MRTKENNKRKRSLASKKTVAKKTVAKKTATKKTATKKTVNSKVKPKKNIKKTAVKKAIKKNVMDKRIPTIRHKTKEKKRKTKIVERTIKTNNAEKLFFLYTDWCLKYKEDREGYILCHRDSYSRVNNITRIDEAMPFLRDVDLMIVKHNLRNSYPHSQAFLNLRHMIEEKIKEIEKNEELYKQFNQK